jgi:pSer/pThr/pTyr-binding forkhead associated (FHA) protein
MDESSAETMPTAYLFLEDGDRIYRVHLEGPKLRLGRSEKNDVVVKSEQVEAEHAEIAFHAPHFVLSSSASLPPSVNGKILEGPRRLYNGDVLNMAGHMMTFVKRPVVSDTVVQLAIWGAGDEPYFLLLNRPEFTLGHGESDIRIADEFLGSPHCAIENFCAGVQYVVPIDEERGVLIGGRKIQRRTLLADGDVLTLGSTEVAVRLHPRCSLPSPADPIPLDGVARARIADELRGEGEPAPDQEPLAKRRRMRDILRDADAEEGAMVGLVDDFEDDEDDDHLYYLPDATGKRRPVPVDARMEEEAGDGRTMVLSVDGKGKPKRERYYLPDGDEANLVRERGAEMEREVARQTRWDVPAVEGAEDDGEGEPEGDDAA